MAHIHEYPGVKLIKIWNVEKKFSRTAYGSSEMWESGGRRFYANALGAHQYSFFRPFKNVLLSRNLDQIFKTWVFFRKKMYKKNYRNCMSQGWFRNRDYTNSSSIFRERNLKAWSRDRNLGLYTHESGN